MEVDVTDTCGGLGWVCDAGVGFGQVIPASEGVVQELDGGIAHGGLGLSDQPVFILQGDIH